MIQRQLAATFPRELAVLFLADAGGRQALPVRPQGQGVCRSNRADGGSDRDQRTALRGFRRAGLSAKPDLSEDAGRFLLYRREALSRQGVVRGWDNCKSAMPGAPRASRRTGKPSPTPTTGEQHPCQERRKPPWMASVTLRLPTTCSHPNDARDTADALVDSPLSLPALPQPLDQGALSVYTNDGRLFRPCNSATRPTER